jgi:hypothetical protein
MDFDQIRESSTKSGSLRHFRVVLIFFIIPGPEIKILPEMDDIYNWNEAEINSACR